MSPPGYRRASSGPAIGTLLALLAATAAHAQAPRTDADSAIRELLKLSGASRQIEILSSRAKTTVRENHPQLTEATLARMDAAPGAAFAQKAMNDALVEGLRLRFDMDGAAGALRWLRSPIGRRAAQVEMAAAGRKRTCARMRRVPPDEDRLRLTRQLEAATGASTFAVELVTGMATTRGRALDPLVPPDARMKPGELDGIIAALRAQLKPQVREAILMMLLFTYRSLGTAELAEIVAFYESDTGLWYTTATSQALLDVMQAAARLVMEVRGAAEGEPSQKNPEMTARKGGTR
jgi:hypothetical protein